MRGVFCRNRGCFFKALQLAVRNVAPFRLKFHTSAFGMRISVRDATPQRLKCHTSPFGMPHFMSAQVWHLPCSSVAFVALKCGICPAKAWHSERWNVASRTVRFEAHLGRRRRRRSFASPFFFLTTTSFFLFILLYSISSLFYSSLVRARQVFFVTCCFTVCYAILSLSSFFEKFSNWLRNNFHFIEKWFPIHWEMILFSLGIFCENTACFRGGYRNVYLEKRYKNHRRIPYI